MNNRRPLPNPDPSSDRRISDRLARWTTVFMAVLVVMMVVLFALWWLVEKATER